MCVCIYIHTVEPLYCECVHSYGNLHNVLIKGGVLISEVSLWRGVTFLVHVGVLFHCIS